MKLIVVDNSWNIVSVGTTIKLIILIVVEIVSVGIELKVIKLIVVEAVPVGTEIE